MMAQRHQKGEGRKSRIRKKKKSKKRKEKDEKKQNMHFQIIKVFWWENSKFKQPVPTQSIHH